MRLCFPTWAVGVIKLKTLQISLFTDSWSIIISTCALINIEATQLCESMIALQNVGLLQSIAKVSQHVSPYRDTEILLVLTGFCHRGKILCYTIALKIFQRAQPVWFSG